MISIPAHVERAGIVTRELSYSWDEWNVKRYYMGIEPEQLLRLDALTNKANQGLTDAIGEWIWARFSVLEDDPIPLQFLEAAWAGMIHPAYCLYVETVDDAWRGPVRGPLAVMIDVVNDALFFLAEDPRVAVRACWLHKLARHVLPATDAFDAWFEACVTRLELYHTKVSDGGGEAGLFPDFPGQGNPVPREAFDPSFPYDPRDAPGLLDVFLQSLRPSANLYLRDPVELMDVKDLPGKPHRYTRS